MGRNLNEDEAKKVSNLFRLTLPEDVFIKWDYSPMYKTYTYRFCLRTEDKIHTTGVMCSKKAPFMKNLWEMLKDIKNFYERISY